MRNIRLKKFLPVSGYVLIVGLVFGPALFPPDGMMIFGDDIHRQYYFFRQFFNEWIGKGIFPWWNPYLFGGEPYIANPVVNIWYPPNWMFVVFPLPHAYSWHLFFHVFWAMLGMYMLLRQSIELRIQNSISSGFFALGSHVDLAAWVGGVVFGLSGFFMARTWAGHVDVIAAASWMPWVVGAFYRLMADNTAGPARFGSHAPSSPGRRIPFYKQLLSNVYSLVSPKGGLLGFARAAGERKNSESGHPQKIIFASVVFAIQLLSGYQTMAFFTVIIVGFMVVAASIGQKSIRPVYKAAIAGLMGVGLAAFHLLPVQELFRQSIRTFEFPYSWHSYGSIEWRSLLQLINPFIFGTQTTYIGPPPNFIEQSLFVGVWAIVLGVIGSISLRYSKSRGMGVVFLLCVAFGVWMALGSNAPFDLQHLFWQSVPMYQYLRIPSRHLIIVIFGVAGLAAYGFALVTHVYKKHKYLPMVLAILIVFELVTFGQKFIELRPIPEERHDKKLIATLKADNEPYRVLQNFGVWIPQRDVLDFDAVMSYGIFSATGYDPSILRPYFEYIAKGAGKRGEQAVLDHDVQVPYLDAQSADTLDFLNIKYILVPSLYDPFSGNPQYKEIIDDAQKGYLVYENTTVKPRFFLENPACGIAAVRKYTPNEVVVDVDVTCASKLLSSEVFYPGWHAYIDNKEIEITKTNNVFRTLFVSPGKHTILWVYKPTIFYWGLAISIASALFAFIFWARPKVRS